MDQIWIFAVLAGIAGLAAGYAIGWRNGFDRGEEQDGWQDEAIWWRENATGIVPKTPKDTQ